MTKLTAATVDIVRNGRPVPPLKDGKMTPEGRTYAIDTMAPPFHSKYEPAPLWPENVDTAWQVTNAYGRYVATYLLEKDARLRAQLESTGYRDATYAPVHRTRG